MGIDGSNKLQLQSPTSFRASSVQYPTEHATHHSPTNMNLVLDDAMGVMQTQHSNLLQCKDIYYISLLFLPKCAVLLTWTCELWNDEWRRKCEAEYCHGLQRRF